MTTTTVKFPDATAKRLRELSFIESLRIRRQVPVSELVRSAVDAYLVRLERREPQVEIPDDG